MLPRGEGSRQGAAQVYRRQGGGRLSSCLFFGKVTRRTGPFLFVETRKPPQLGRGGGRVRSSAALEPCALHSGKPDTAKYSVDSGASHHMVGRISITPEEAPYHLSYRQNWCQRSRGCDPRGECLRQGGRHSKRCLRISGAGRHVLQQGNNGRDHHRLHCLR